MTIAVLGGTFDPIHNGHLTIASHAFEHCNLSKILFIPCHIPALRGTPQATATQRLDMVELAIADNQNFIADDREINRSGTSYMIDTLQSLHDENPNEEIALILGFDAWQNFHKWHGYQYIVKNFLLIIINRPNYQLSHAQLLQQHKQTIKIIEDSNIQTSATMIRRQLQKDPEQAAQYLPATVYRYIQQHQLYQND